jgi:rhodanese-related sulfurtransferase
VFGRTTHPETSPAAAHASAEDVLLIDVREDDEWAAGHAPGAQHFALSRLDPARLPDADTVLCICRSGNRSARAVAALRQQGVNAVNVAGGMNAWAVAGLPVVRADGRPGTVI